MLTSLFFTAFTLSLLALPDSEGLISREAMRLIGSRVPFLMANIVAGAINLAGGISPAISFMATVRVVEVMVPVLPNMNWVDKAFTAVLVTAMVYIALSKQLGHRVQSSKRGNLTLALAVIIVSLTWFTQGMIGYYALVITSGSMRPNIEVGDLIIVKELSNKDSIKVGDVILIRANEGLVAHRVISIVDEGGNRLFITKGDANSAPDPEPAGDKNVIGVVVAKIPKLGWPTLWVRDAVRMLLSSLNINI
jgi:signal peptidase